MVLRKHRLTMSRYYHIQLLCVFVIPSLFAHGRGYGDTYDVYVNDNNNYYNDFGTDGNFDDLPPPPPGYSYVPMSEILANYDPNTYRIVSYGEAMYGLDNDGFGGGGLLRKKRSYFSPFSNLFGSDVPEDQSSTATTVTKTDVNGDVKTVVTSAVTSTDVDGDVKTVATSAVTSTTGDVPADHDDHQMTAVEKVKGRLMDIVYIGRKDVENSLVVSAPYLPVVCKVAMFLVPGLSSYEVLMMSVNVATITAQALREYEDGESVSDITVDVAKKLAMDTLLTKRDTGATVRQYATHIYDSVKDFFKSRFGSSKENTSSSPEKDSPEEVSDIGIPDIKNNVQNVHKIVKTKIVNGVEIPETETIMTEYGSALKHQITNDKLISAAPIQGNFERSLGNKITDMKKKIKNSDSSGSDDCKDSDEDSDDSDFSGFTDDTNEKNGSVDSNDSDDSQDSDESIEVNQELFDKVLEKTMNLQPDEIKNKTDEELVNYIDTYETNFPADPEFDPTNVFSVLISSMKFDDNVTEDQRRQLVTMLGKTTNYFIDKNLKKSHNMPILGN